MKPRVDALTPPAAAETNLVGRKALQPTSGHPGHSPSHLLGSSGAGDSHVWAADMMEAGPHDEGCERPSLGES